MSTQRIYETVVEVARRRVAMDSDSSNRYQTHLDIGAGSGELIERFHRAFEVRSWACDYTDELMKQPGQTVEIVDLNHRGLPYEDGRFDIVTATEVVEHLEHYRQTLREVFRVLKPGGVCILTTPNILNLNSRLRFLWFGFWNLFGPLPVKHGALYSTGGHINPVSYFYLAHALMDAEFTDVASSVDKWQRSSMVKLALLWVPIRLFAAWAWHRERSRFHTITPDNAPLVREMNSVAMLLGRTIVVSARKPG